MSDDLRVPANLFNKLADEVIEIIIRHLDSLQYSETKRDIQSFSSCDMRIRRITLPMVYRDIRLDTSAKMYYFFHRLLDFPQQLSAHQVSSETSVIDQPALVPITVSNDDAYEQSNVETLRLYSCNFTEDELRTLLKLPKALKSFSFLSERPFGSTMPPGIVREALDCVSDTLDTLVLEFSDSFLRFPQLWSLSHFKSLKTLSISHRLLFSRGSEDIIERLPPSLETLVLRILQGHKPLGGINILESVRILLTRKSSTVLRRLKTVALLDFPQYVPLVKTILMLCYYNNVWHHPDIPKALQAVDLSRILKESRDRSLPADIIAKAEERAEWAITFCLLPLLSNLEGFRIQPGDTHPDDMNQHSAKPFYSRFLSPSLRWVHLDVYGWDWTPYRVDLLIPFFSFPAITQISVNQMESNSTTLNQSPLALPMPNGDIYNRSRVKTLRLYSCRIPDDVLKMLLRHPKALDKFVWLCLRYTQNSRSAA
ncbi:hypothetical protein CPB86DRAFT_876958 [Serendipita vermifera]|nr:hypothetical protein CPB86DRAFT_876958 [Serendipita vermifera]